MRSRILKSEGRRKTFGTIALALNGLTPRQTFNQLRQIVGVLLFRGLNLFDHSAGRCVEVCKIGGYLPITVDGDTLSHKILSDHVQQRCPFDIFRMTPRQQSFGGEIRGATELNDALRNAVCVLLFFRRVLQPL